MGETSAFPILEHSSLKEDLARNYSVNHSLFQEVAQQVSRFKMLRSIDFKHGRQGNKIHVYYDSIERNTDGKAFAVNGLNDPQLPYVLEKEGLSVKDLEALKSKLDRLNCNSFFSFVHKDIYTGKTYVAVELQYNIWNGINFYYYKIYDRAMDNSMTASFISSFANVNEGAWTNKGGIVDSNAVWYYVNY